jgi:hypothetical protein
MSLAQCSTCMSFLGSIIISVYGTGRNMLGYSKRYSTYNHKTKWEFHRTAKNWYVATD